jgi:hypothetical protein
VAAGIPLPSLNSCVEKAKLFRHAAEAICCRDDGAPVSVTESENRMMQTERGDEVVNESGWDCAFVLGKESRGLDFSAVVMVSASSLLIVRGEVEESGRQSSFWLVSVEEESVIEKVSASNFCLSCGVVVCVNGNAIESVIASDWHSSLYYVGARTGSASVIASVTSSYYSYCSLSGCRYAHESCAKGSLLAAEARVQAWAYS